MRGLFYNTQKAQCSIHESGLMVFKALARSSCYTLEYRELPTPLTDIASYDFVVFNWHHYTMRDVTESVIRSITIPKYTVVTECAPDNPIPQTPDWFDGYLVLDPTIKDSGKIYGMPRPLEIRESGLSLLVNVPPIIGSFGFATVGKRFDLLIEEVNKEFDSAIIKLNIPPATYVHNTAHIDLANSLRSLPKPGIELHITHDYMTKQELIDWCAYNELNVFFYYRNMIGLAAVTDQAISAKRPILVTEDYTFRHLHPYIGYYPQVSLTQAMENKPAVEKMFNDWHPDKFAQKFERILNG